MKKRAKSVASIAIFIATQVLRLFKSSHDKFKNKLSSIIGNKNFIKLPTNGTEFQGKKAKGALGYSWVLLKVAVSYLIENCYFKMGNIVM